MSLNTRPASRTRRPALGNLTGGLSGPAIRPLAVYAVYSTYPRIRIPIIGMGGIVEARDAVEFLLGDGASFVCGSVLFVDGGHDAMLRPDQF